MIQARSAPGNKAGSNGITGGSSSGRGVGSGQSSAPAPLAANAASIAISPTQERTKDSATVVVGDGTAFLLGVVDLEKERDKLGKQKEKLTSQIASLAQKLGNESFRQKAPPQVIAQQEESLRGLRQQLAGVEQGLSELAD